MKLRHRIAISMGDPSGIGAEIVVKALSRRDIYAQSIPVVIGDRAAMEDAIRFTNSELSLNIIDTAEEARGAFGMIDLIDMKFLSPGSWTYKTVCEISGEASFQYVVKAIRLAMERAVAAVVTGPINKEAINLAGRRYAGHTEILAEYTNTKEYGMLLCADALRVVHVTTHVSMREACDIIRDNPQRIQSAIRLASDAMKELGIASPRIAVAGLNAHCSENGLFGSEEEISIIPAIKAQQLEGIDVDGPIPPDTVFVKAMAGQYDVVVAMYHDQGHIPLKLSGFRLDPQTKLFTSISGVNATLGLPIIRTSVDHGTAYDKAGEGRANEESMADAINMALAMAQKRFPL